MAFLTELDSEKAILDLAQKIIESLNLDFKGIKISASVGVVFDESGSCDFKRLYSVADKVLYIAKNKNKGRYELERIHKKL